MTPASGGDLPVFDESPPGAVAFAPQALRSPGRPGPVAAGAWVVAIVCLVGFGVFAGEPDPGPPRSADDAPPAPIRPDPRLPSTRMGALLGLDVIEIVAPSPARVEITTRRLDVAGAVHVRAARVRIRLEARGNRVLEHVSVDISDLHGGIRPEFGPTFSTSFDLPLPRPSGTMWVVVTAYDERGMPLGGTRRAFVVGPLAGPAPDRAHGDSIDRTWPWRSYGGAVAAAPLPTCMAVSTTVASSC